MIGATGGGLFLDRFHVSAGGQCNDGSIGEFRDFSQPSGCLKAPHYRHMYIDKDQLRVVPLRYFKSLLPISGNCRDVVLHTEHILDHGKQHIVILDNENTTAAGAESPSRKYMSGPSRSRRQITSSSPPTMITPPTFRWTNCWMTTSSSPRASRASPSPANTGDRPA